MTFTSYCLRNISWKARAAVDIDSCDGTEQNKLKTFWKGLTILDDINIHDLREEVKISTLTGVQEKLVLTLMDVFEEFKTLHEGVLELW